MSKILETATGHFRSQLGGAMSKITVDEWGMDIYFKTITTLKEQSKLVELAGSNKTVEALVESLIIRGRNAEGKRLFTSADKVTFMNEVDPTVLIRVVSEMNEAIESVEKATDIEKN